MILSALLIFLAGTLHGLREAYHAQPDVFENIIKGTDRDFFGKKAWLGRYIGGKVENGPIWIYRYIGHFDFWHVSRWLENGCVAGCIWALSGNWVYAAAYIAVITTGGFLSYKVARK